MSKVDLHIHSCVSDGRYMPEEIVIKAADAGMAVISLADHDNVDGIVPALEEAEKHPPLRLIPGVEISTESNEGEVHVLGYFIDYLDDRLLSALAKMRFSRETRAEKMIEKLAALGLPLEIERVRALAGEGSTGRPHVAQAMMEKGYVTNFQEAFNKYLAWGGPAYVERDKMRPDEAVNLILQSGGIPVLAHPLTADNPEPMIAFLKKSGLAGIEVYYKGYKKDEIEYLLDLAGIHNLIATGGSDYHGIDENTESPIGGPDVPLEVAENLISLAGKQTP